MCVYLYNKPLKSYLPSDPPCRGALSFNNEEVATGEACWGGQAIWLGGGGSLCVFVCGNAQRKEKEDQRNFMFRDDALHRFCPSGGLLFRSHLRPSCRP